MKIQYTLGTHSYTPFFDLKEEPHILERQLKLSCPLITSVKLIHKKIEKNIFVGKEIDLQDRSLMFWLKKYDLSLDDVSDIWVQGYHKACLLNYKKYDQVLVGVEEKDEIVPDYFALKEKLRECKERALQ